MSDDIDPATGLNPTTRLYEALIELIIASPDANDCDVAMSALAHALLQVAKCADVSPIVVITNIATMCGAVVAPSSLDVDDSPKGSRH